MSYQNINQYQFKKWYLKLVYGSYDISLASDEVDFNQEVVFSPYLIGQADGNRLPFNFDLNENDVSQKLTLNYKEYISGNTYISQNFYNPKNEDLFCFTSQTLCDIGLTGTDNGLVDQMTGKSITYTMGLLEDDEKFNRLSFDRRLKLFQTTGYTNLPNQRFSGNTKRTLYEVISKIDDKAGYYNELYGGFYQGFFKLFGYDYEIFPERVNKGWTAEFLLRPRIYDEYSPSINETTLNQIYPENKNIFFYFGTRSENKFYHPAEGSPTDGYVRVTTPLKDCLKTCACSDTGVTNSRCINVYPSTASTTELKSDCCGCYEEIDVTLPDSDPKLDTLSNALSFRLCGDPKNPKIGFKTLTFTGGCSVTGSCKDTGYTYTTGYTITDKCTDRGIYDFCVESGFPDFLDTEKWVMVSFVWERNMFLDECDLQYRGGLKSITDFEYLETLNNESVNLIIPPITSENIDPQLIEIINLNQKWIQEKKYRKGKLKIYVNGKLFQTFDDVEEIIPRGLNTEKEKQLGVPFNISWGGGTQGLRESLIFSACPTGLTNNYIQDPELMPNNTLSGTSLSNLNTNILLEQNFGGTLEGGISQFRMYVEPLTLPEIKHNFKILKDKFDLFDYDCPQCFPQNCGYLNFDAEYICNVDPTIINLTLFAIHTPGSIKSKYILVSDTYLPESTTFQFTNLLGTQYGIPITISSEITITKDELSGHTIVIDDGNYNDLNFNSQLSNFTFEPNRRDIQYVVDFKPVFSPLDDFEYSIIPDNDFSFGVIPDNDFIFSIIPNDDFIFSIIPNDDFIFSIIPDNDLESLIIPNGDINDLFIPVGDVNDIFIPEGDIMHEPIF